MKLKIKKMHKDAVTPKYNKLGDSGIDLASVEDITILPGQTTTIPTGLAFGIPSGHEIQIRPRSGLSLFSGLRVIFGTVDSNYLGEIKIICENRSTYPHVINKGDRIAQAVVCPIITCEIEECLDLGTSSRDDKGFGSTGV